MQMERLLRKSLEKNIMSIFGANLSIITGVSWLYGEI
jgi:hypothetical protein